MTEFRSSVDPFEIDLFQRFPARMREHGFAEGHDSLLDARDRAFEENEVVLDFSVPDEAAHTSAIQQLLSDGKKTP